MSASDGVRFFGFDVRKRYLSPKPSNMRERCDMRRARRKGTHGAAGGFSRGAHDSAEQGSNFLGERARADLAAQQVDEDDPDAAMAEAPVADEAAALRAQLAEAVAEAAALPT